jgi:hypothetical protein
MKTELTDNYTVEVNVNFKMDVELQSDSAANAVEMATDMAGHLIDNLRIKRPQNFNHITTSLDIRTAEIGWVYKNGDDTDLLDQLWN